MTTPTASRATDVYALGSNPEESARLRRQSDELRSQSAELLDRIGLRPGQSAIDLGCGPSGILSLLSAAVSLGGRVVGLDADPAHTAMASQYAGEPRHTGRPGWPTSRWRCMPPRTRRATRAAPSSPTWYAACAR